MKRLTIGIFVEHYDPFVSGVITSVKSLKYELEKAGHTVYIICPSVKGYKDTDKHVIRTLSLTSRFVPNTTLGFASPALTRRLMKIKFDVIHSQDVFLISLLGLRVARRQNIPYIQTIHTLWDKFFDQYNLNPMVYVAGGTVVASAYLRTFGARRTLPILWRPQHHETEQKWHLASRYIWQFMLLACRQADAVIVPSFHQKDLLKAAHLDRSVVRVTNSFPPFQMQKAILTAPKPGSLRVICVARLSAEKRVNILIKAIRQLNDPSVELIIVGDGPQRAELQQLASKLKLDNQVRFMGLQSNSYVRQLMRESHALALASYNFDTQPMVFDEALDAGLPIIYCDPKFIEAVSPANAILARKDAAGLAAAIAKLKNQSLRQKMSKASQRMAKDFRSSRSAHQILAIYQKAIELHHH